jgi:hypothetical protein
MTGSVLMDREISAQTTQAFGSRTVREAAAACQLALRNPLATSPDAATTALPCLSRHRAQRIICGSTTNGRSRPEG